MAEPVYSFQDGSKAESDVRLGELQAAMAGFNRQYSAPRLQSIITDTLDINFDAFKDACKRLRALEEPPTNLILFIRSGNVTLDRKYCDRCGVYVDGVQQCDNEGHAILFGLPGMQLHKKSTGSLYDRVGYTCPCVCASGRIIAQNRGGDKK